MASKRKHSTLTLKDKLEVLKRLDEGEGVTKNWLQSLMLAKLQFVIGEKIVESLNNTVLILLARLLKTDRQQSNRCTIKLIMRFIFGLPRKEDGETAEFLTDDNIAAAVTQEPMEEEGSDDETQCDKKDVVPHADGAAAFDLPCATWSNSPTLHQLMCYL
ncbi:hypothetical protein TNCV_756661 [Trichonephila clavipes]|nr:hypothetical protein TNCV_756661 [Trichonephila clavipes]